MILTRENGKYSEENLYLRRFFPRKFHLVKTDKRNSRQPKKKIISPLKIKCIRMEFVRSHKFTSLIKFCVAIKVHVILYLFCGFLIFVFLFKCRLVKVKNPIKKKIPLIMVSH
jgi:hypothetical protein